MSAPTICRRPERRRRRSLPLRSPPPTPCSTRCEIPAKCRRRNFPRCVGRISLLRQCRRPLHHRDVQDARLRRSVGRDRREALRRHRSRAPALPLRRAGQLARAHRAAAGEQRLSHPALDARRDAVEEGPRPRRAAPRLERGARPAAALGPAMVAQAAADRGLRDRPARIWRHLRRLRGHRRARSRS